MAQAPFPESHNINQYRQKCDYKISKFYTKIDKTKFKLPDDPESKLVCKTVLEREGGAQIKIKFDDNSLYENETKVSFQGPSLCSTCTISSIKKTFYHREFGYIQTSKRFFENEFEKAIVYSDFHANLLHEQNEVLDSDRESSPFYSTESCTKVLANEDLAHTIELHFSDCPSSDILKINGCKSSKTSPKHDWGYLQKHEKYQQFFVYLVMRSKQNSEDEWKYDVLFSFDWFIYWKWVKVTDKNNNIFEYNCGINVNDPVRKLPKLMEYYACNDDQLEYWIDKIDCKFNIDNIQKSILQNKLECITLNANKLCGNVEITDLNTEELDDIDSFISNGKDLCKDVKSINLEINAFNDYTSIASGVKKCDKDIENIDREENIYRETYRNISEKVRKLYGNITHLDPIELNIYEGIESLLPEVNRLCENVTKMDLNKKETFEKYSDVKKLYGDRENVDSENSRRNYSNIVGKLYVCIREMDPIERNIYKGIERLLPEVNRLCENVKNMDLYKKNTFENYSVVKKLYEDRENVDSENINRHYSNIEGKVDDLHVCITEMNKIEPMIYEGIERLLPELKRLTKNIETIYLEKIDFSENLRCVSFEVNKLCECIEMMDLDKKDFRGNCKTVFWEAGELLKCTNRKDLDGIKESILNLNPKVKKLCKDESINIEKSKFCKCNYLDETDLCEIIKNKLFERNNKENFGQVEQQPIEGNKRRLSEQDRFLLLASGALITSSENVIDDSQ